MGQKTYIEWTDATWNPVTGCTKISPGCDNCYAERLTKRFKQKAFSQINLHFERVLEPLRWQHPKMIFTCSMSDLFHPEVPWDFIIKVFSIMEKTQQHTYQILTKRPGRMAYFANNILFPEFGYWPSNVWAGTSVESQKYVSRIDVLTRVPAKVRFVSCEPLLEYLDIRPWLEAGAIQWVIVGGESGVKARPVQLAWFNSLKTQCKNAKVPIFVKQLGTAWARPKNYGYPMKNSKGGDITVWPSQLRVRQYPFI